MVRHVNGVDCKTGKASASTLEDAIDVYRSDGQTLNRLSPLLRTSVTAANRFNQQNC